MAKSLIVAVGLATALTAAAAAQPGVAAQSKASNPDEKFMTMAIQGDLAEIQMGKLAQANGDAQAKQFGRTLVTDHSANLDKAKRLAGTLQIVGPTEPSRKEAALEKKMSKLSGAAFDRRFAQQMVQDHEKDIAKFRQEAKATGPVAKFAQETLPVLEKHLKMAQALLNSERASR